MELIVDDREKAVVPYLDKHATTYHIDYKVQRNEVGDYAITYKGYIMMIIERKTWEDLSASFRDGRKDNVNKLIELRNRTGCQIAYLIEGNATPPLTKSYGRIPSKNLRAHLDHLAIRDGVHMIYSADQDYTAMRLFELCNSYVTLKEPLKEVDALIEGGEEQDNTDELQSDMGVKTSIEEQLLRCLPGIGSIVSTVLAEAGVTIAKLYAGHYTIDQIAKLKYSSGAMIGIAKAKKIVEGTKKIIDSEAQANKKIQVRILSTISLISKASAEMILSQTKMSLIMSGGIDLDLLANVEKSAKAKVGPKAAQNILDALVAEPVEVKTKAPIIAKRGNKTDS